jgi:MFS family permease
VTDVPRTDTAAETEGAPSRGSWATYVFRTSSLYRALPALQYRDFRLFWVGQLISLTGTWIQSVAQQWLVLELTGSAFKLGLVTTVQFTPLLLLSLVGGAIADRFPKRDLLLATQVVSLILALGLGILVKTGTVQYWHVLVFAGMLGTVNAFYTPARQAFVPELVDRETLLNAVALNSAIFNGARVVGPAVGGILVASVGLSLNFFLNAASYVAVIWMLLLITPRPVRPAVEGQRLWHNVREGLGYIVATPVVSTILVLVGVASLFALNFTTLMPLVARYVLHTGSDGFGFLMASMGVGSLTGAISLAFLKRRDLARPLILTGCIVFTIGEIALALSRAFPLSVGLLVLIGLTSTLFTTTANTRILSLTPPELQGRVMSVYSLMFLGMTPFGSVLSGLVAQHWGTPPALIIGGAVTLAFAVGLLVFRPEQRRARAAGEQPGET